MRKTLACLILALSPLHADEDTFREKFADPATRTAALAELIPGTREAFFHTALDHQLAGREADFRKVTAEWKTAILRRENPVDGKGLDMLENRQLLMAYAKDPSASLASLIRRFELKFDHTRPDAAAEAENIPTRVDAAEISREAFEKAAATRSPDQPYSHYTGRRLLEELSNLENFDEPKIRWFLENLGRPDHPGVVPLIDRSMRFTPPLEFGALEIHKKLVSSQLAALLELHPALRSNEAFNVAYLEKLRPGEETDFRRDRNAHATHLRNCRDYALTLPAAADSLKAHVLFHHLRLQSKLGNFPKEDFIAFLTLPRRQSHLFPKKEQPVTPIELNENFISATGCDPIEDEGPLIESYLGHFLGAADDAAAEFVPYIKAAKLAELHARARLLAGADTQRWGAVIPPADFKSLQEQTLISFAPGAPSVLPGTSEVSLALDLKNTPELRVRIYELDLPAHLARTGGEPSVSLDLEGLVPHHERRVTYPNAPIHRHRETIALPELAGPGVWIVEFLSGQVSARTLVRKGQLIPYVERIAGGQTVRLFDETGAVVPGGTLKLGTATFAADADGRFLIPNTAQQSPEEGIALAGKLAAPLKVGQREDSFSLRARFHLDREQLLADQEAKLHLRVRLANQGEEIPLDQLKDPALVLKAELLGGITTERVIAEDLKLSPVMEIPFQVPADLLKLTFTLRGTVQPALGGDPIKLGHEESFRLNGDLTKPQIARAYFSPTAAGHRLELRGRNGEPLASRILRLSLSSGDYSSPVNLAVRTDADGRVDLGKLEGIHHLSVTGTDIGETEYDPLLRSIVPAGRIQIAAGKDILLPLEDPAAAPDRSRLFLIETRQEQNIRDHFEKLSVENGRIIIRGLPPGAYTFGQNSDETSIVVSAGTEQHGLLASAARILPVTVPAHPVIEAATADNGQLTIRIRDAGPATRVTVTGSRFSHSGWDAGNGGMPFSRHPSPSLVPGIIPCEYLTEKLLDDEMRYIFDRRSQKVFPGSMLPRPGLLLNRWTEKDLDQDTKSGAQGADGESRGDGILRSARGPFFGTEMKRGNEDHPAVVDFLARPSLVRFDLKPEADGTLKLPLADFQGSQFIEIRADDTAASDTLILPLPASDTPLRDRRIARPLDPKGHHLATRSAAVLAKGAEAAIENLLDAEWRAFTTLEEAHQFLYGMTNDDRLREFAFLTEWPEFDEKKKLELLSGHACHEFHLFLARKDKAFFDKHVKPLLAQKAEPVFMDDLLLERDLKGYLRPFAWRKLNAAEKALLARALPEARERIARELSLRWQIEAPAPDLQTILFTQTLRGTDLSTLDSLGLARNAYSADDSSSSGVAYMTEKLKTIIIPRIDFEDTTVEEALDFLRLRSVEMDTMELDPAKKGVNFIARIPRGSESKIRELKLNNVPLGVALQYIADAAKLGIKKDDFAVTLAPATEVGEDIFTRTFNVPPDFVASLAGAGGITTSAPVIEALRANGIIFAEGSSATLRGGILIIRNTPSELEKIEQLTNALAANRGGQGIDPAMDPFSSGVLPDISAPADAFAPADPFASDNPGSALRARLPRLPLFAERTRLWRESNYFRNTAATDESLIPLNRFWMDLAAWDGNGPFLSAHFNACHHNANEALVALAMLDLPFKAERPEVTVDGSTLRVKAREPMLLFYKDTKRTDKLAPESPLLVRQTFSPLAEPFRTVDGKRIENPVTGDFRPGIPYRASLVVTNPTGIGRRIDLLAQIPAGAIPLGGQPLTLSVTSDLAPYGVLMKELDFYFPAPGEFAAYPLHVNEDGTVLAHSDQRTLRVSNDPAPQDASSWLVLSSEGTNPQVLDRLRTENLDTIDLSVIRWRLKDKAFFTSVTALMRERLHFSEAIAAYGFHHNDTGVIRDYLENSPLNRALGLWLDSPLLDVRPRIHHHWETLEFDPLVNARAHRFGGESRITHAEAKAHYHAFLEQLGWKPSLDDSDQLTLTAFLFLQDRIDEALARFDLIDPAKLPGRIHYDYLHAVALFYREKPADARAIAAGRLPALPPGVWQERFQAVISQADEITALTQAPPSEKSGKEAPAPQLDLATSGDGKLLVRHRSLEKASLRLFSVDLEILFSKDPFLKGGDNGNADPSIRPNADLEIQLAADTNETTVDLPEAMRKGNVLVSADSSGTRLLKVLDSRELDIRHVPADRTVQVLDLAGKPLPKTYIKVYTETRSGEVAFHKDGYTDLRGKFDYLSHTAIDSSTIKRVAILISHPEKGARTVIYDR